MIHYYDPDDDTWKSVADPSASGIAEVIIAAARSLPCTSCDADCEYEWNDGGPPHIVVTHKDGCAA